MCARPSCPTTWPIVGSVQPLAGQVFDKPLASTPLIHAVTRTDTIQPTSLDHSEAIGSTVAHSNIEAGGLRSHACELRGCRASFTRKSCLYRHVRTVHEKGRQYLCPVKGCFRGPYRRIFARIDKLKAHILAVHDIDSTVECPHAQCSGSSMTWLELTVHAEIAGQSHRSYTSDTEVVSRFVEWADYLHCPVKGCKQQPRIDALASYVLEHFTIKGAKVTQNDIDQLWKIGLRPVATSCVHGRHIITTTSCPIEKTYISCPVCSTLCEDTNIFREHMVASHLIEPAELEHFLSWRSVLVDKLVGWTDFAQKIGRFGLEDAALELHIFCSRCGWTESVGWYIIHHLSMFRTDLSHLKPYRSQILRLYPKLDTLAGWQRLWDDLARPLGRVVPNDANDIAN